jgi:hypothetical protein
MDWTTTYQKFINFDPDNGTLTFRAPPKQKKPRKSETEKLQEGWDFDDPEKKGSVYLYRGENQQPVGEGTWQGRPAKLVEGTLRLNSEAEPDLIDMKNYQSDDQKQKLVDSIVNPKLEEINAAVRVQKTSDGRGYGLFAIRNIPKNDIITQYGGLVYAKCREIQPEEGFADYVMSEDSTWYDAGRYFFPEDAGRWINEPPYGLPYLVNAKPGKKTKQTYPLIAKHEIWQGKEILLKYGSDYNRKGWGADWVLESGTLEQVNQMVAYLKEVDKTAPEKKQEVKQWLDKAEAKLKRLCLLSK